VSARLVALAAVACMAVLLGCAAHRPSASTVHVVENTRASALLSTRCGSCHAVPNPATMPAEKWLAALDRMKHRMQLPAADWDSLAALAADDSASESH
jgi:hypothetical protein